MCADFLGNKRCTLYSIVYFKKYSKSSLLPCRLTEMAESRKVMSNSNLFNSWTTCWLGLLDRVAVYVVFCYAVVAITSVVLHWEVVCCALLGCFCTSLHFTVVWYFLICILSLNSFYLILDYFASHYTLYFALLGSFLFKLWQTKQKLTPVTCLFVYLLAGVSREKQFGISSNIAQCVSEA